MDQKTSSIQVKGRSYTIETAAELPPGFWDGNQGVYDQLRADAIAMKPGEIHVILIENRSFAELMRQALQAVSPHTSARSKEKLLMNRRIRTRCQQNDDGTTNLYYTVYELIE